MLIVHQLKLFCLKQDSFFMEQYLPASYDTSHQKKIDEQSTKHWNKYYTEINEIPYLNLRHRLYLGK